MPKAKMTLWSTLTDVEGGVGSQSVIVVTWQCTLQWKTYKMHSLYAYEVKELWPSVWCCWVWMIYSLKKSRAKACMQQGWKLELLNITELNEEWEAVCHFVYCISLFSSVKAVAHLLIRADVPANHSDEEEGEKKKRRIQNSISKEAISSLLNEPQMMRVDREFELMSSHVTHGLFMAAIAFLMQGKQVAKKVHP